MASYVTASLGINSLKKSWVYSFMTWALFGTSFIEILILVYNFNLHFFFISMKFKPYVTFLIDFDPHSGAKHQNAGKKTQH